MINIRINVAEGRVEFETGYRIPREDFMHLRKYGFLYHRLREQFEAPYRPQAVHAAKEVLSRLSERWEVEFFAIPDDYEGKAERYMGYAQNASRRASQRFNSAHNIVGQIPPGQPILRGHHSEKQHRRALERADSNIFKGVEEERKAKYWERRARGVLARSERFNRRSWIGNRIEEAEALQRKAERGDISYPDEWLEYLDHRLRFLRSLWDQLPKQEEPQVGGWVRFIGRWYRIVRVSKKSVTVEGWHELPFSTYRIPRHDLKEVRPPESDDWDKPQIDIPAGFGPGWWVKSGRLWFEVEQVKGKTIVCKNPFGHFTTPYKLKFRHVEAVSETSPHV